jgi:hypothetical protein
MAEILARCWQETRLERVHGERSFVSAHVNSNDGEFVKHFSVFCWDFERRSVCKIQELNDRYRPPLINIHHHQTNVVAGRIHVFRVLGITVSFFGVNVARRRDRLTSGRWILTKWENGIDRVFQSLGQFAFFKEVIPLHQVAIPSGYYPIKLLTSFAKSYRHFCSALMSRIPRLK